jgi:hypothetical protein
MPVREDGNRHYTIFDNILNMYVISKSVHSAFRTSTKKNVRCILSRCRNISSWKSSKGVCERECEGGGEKETERGTHTHTHTHTQSERERDREIKSERQIDGDDGKVCDRPSFIPNFPEPKNFILTEKKMFLKLAN